MAMKNFRALDMLGAQEHPSVPRPRRPKRRRGDGTDEAIVAPTEDNDTAVAPESTEEEEDDDDDDKPPSGSAAEVLGWVDRDPARAQVALDQEKSSATPRKGLSTELEGLVQK